LKFSDAFGELNLTLVAIGLNDEVAVFGGGFAKLFVVVFHYSIGKDKGNFVHLSAETDEFSFAYLWIGEAFETRFSKDKSESLPASKVFGNGGKLVGFGKGLVVHIEEGSREKSGYGISCFPSEPACSIRGWDFALNEFPGDTNGNNITLVGKTEEGDLNLHGNLEGLKCIGFFDTGEFLNGGENA